MVEKPKYKELTAKEKEDLAEKRKAQNKAMEKFIKNCLVVSFYLIALVIIAHALVFYFAVMILVWVAEMFFSMARWFGGKPTDDPGKLSGITQKLLSGLEKMG